MTVRKFKRFFSVATEEKFLNTMGAKQLLLTGMSSLFYIFEQSEKKWSYSAEWLDSSPDTEENRKYITEKCKEENLRYCGKRACFAYFATEGEAVLEKSHEAKSKIKKRYRSLSIFWSILSAYMAGLMVYNIIWAEKFKAMGYKVHDDTAEIERIFTFVVGKNPAVLFLYIVIPLTAMVLAVAVLYWFEYVVWIKKCPKPEKRENDSMSMMESADEKPQL